MGMIVEVLLVVCAVFVVWVIFGESKLPRRVRSFFWRKADSQADKFGSAVTDYRDAVVTARSDVAEFRRQISTIMGKNKVAQSEHVREVSEAQKWGTLAEEAAKVQNADHVKQCLDKRTQHEKRASTLLSQVEKNAGVIEQLRQQLATREEQVNDAALNADLLDARNAGAGMREKMLNASKAFGGKDSLGTFQELENEIATKEAQVDAMEELAGVNSGEKLEALYSSTTNDDEVQQLMAQFGGQK